MARSRQPPRRKPLSKRQAAALRSAKAAFRQAHLSPEQALRRAQRQKIGREIRARRHPYRFKVPVVIEGKAQILEVFPATAEARSRIGKLWSKSGKGKMPGIGNVVEEQDYNIIRDYWSLRDRSIPTSEGVVIATDDPDALEELDRAGELTPQDIIVGKYPKRA